MSHEEPSFQLSTDDQLALEWLLEHGLDPSGAPKELAARASRLAALLELAGEADVPHDASLQQSVLDRLDALRSPEFVLSEADQDALDAVMMTGMDASRVPSALRERTDRVLALTALLGGASQAHDSALTDRVMAAVDAQGAVLETERPVLARIGGRFADLVSVAAVVLIAASVVWPVLTTVRQNAVRQANQANLAVAGLGFGAYAADYQGELPRLSDRAGDAQWWNVGEDPSQSNSAGLYTLARLRYTPIEALASPGNPSAPRAVADAGARDWRSPDEVSYSYLLPFAGPNTAAAPGVVLADRSPVVVRLLAGETVRLSENSPNHDGRGQHMLKGDGSVLWTTEPYTEYGDHVYLPRPIEQAVEALRRQMRLSLDRMPPPSGRADVFLGP